MTACSSCAISVSLLAALAKSPFWSSEPSCLCVSTPSWVRTSSFLSSVPSTKRKRKKKSGQDFWDELLRQCWDSKKKILVFPLELSIFYSRSSPGIVVKNIYMKLLFWFLLTLSFRSILISSAHELVKWSWSSIKGLICGSDQNKVLSEYEWSNIRAQYSRVSTRPFLHLIASCFFLTGLYPGKFNTWMFKFQNCIFFCTVNWASKSKCISTLHKGAW